MYHSGVFVQIYTSDTWLTFSYEPSEAPNGVSQIARSLSDTVSKPSPMIVLARVLGKRQPRVFTHVRAELIRNRHTKDSASPKSNQDFYLHHNM